MKLQANLPPAYLEFRHAFAAICEAFGGTINERGIIGHGSAYAFQTPLGELHVSTCYDDYYTSKRAPFIQSIFLRFKTYTGPMPFPLDGREDFNRFSHKWNLTYSSGESIKSARQIALQSLTKRLEKVMAWESIPEAALLEPADLMD